MLTLIRTGKPDYALFKSGDTWASQAMSITQNGPGVVTNGDGSISGIILFSSYGTGNRPLFTNTVTQISNPNATSGLDVAIVGLRLYDPTRDPNNGSFISPAAQPFALLMGGWVNGTWLLIEDCEISFFWTGPTIEGNTNQSGTVTLRRNVIHDNYCATGVSGCQGVFLDTVANPVLIENVFDHNGWNPTLGQPADSASLIRNRNIYIQNQITGAGATPGSGPVLAQRNISLFSSAEGAQFRPGGTAFNNLMGWNSCGFDVGHTETGHAGITSASITSNVSVNSTDLPGLGASGPRGEGICLQNATTSSVSLTSNIIAHASTAAPHTNELGISIDSNVSGTVVNNNIIYDFVAGISCSPCGNTTSPNAIELDNLNTSGYQAAVTNTDLIGYCFGQAGGSPATTAGYEAAILQESKSNFTSAYQAAAINDCIRTIFNQPQIGH